jgi:HSP20 family protein
MECLFDRWFRDWEHGAPVPQGELTGAYPVDVREEDGKLIVDAEMPGFRREEVDVSIDNGVLTITAERKPEQTKGTRHLTERRCTRVERSFTLPAPVDESRVQAKLEHGLLHLELPLTEESKARRIAVK